MNRRSFNVSPICVAVCLASGAAVAEIPISEHDALVALYISTNGADWDDNGGWLGAAGTECSWYGITCGASDTTVTAINLASNNLQGPLPSIVDQLPALEFLNLTGNNLSGQLPTSLGSLGSLQELWLGYGGSLTGTIPSELGNLSDLTVLELDGHDLEGSIPLSIFALGNLEYLYLSSNNLTGGIPSAVSGLTSIKHLYLGWNPLGGPIPTELGSLATLEHLLLPSCDLTGGIPPSLGGLSNLFYLYLDSNELTGAIPASLGDLPQLYALEVDYNQLSGAIPSELAALDDLVFLNLSHNSISGPIPPQLSGLASLRYLWLRDNSLSGSIPGELGNFPSIRSIDLSDNRLSGPIPVGLASSATLESIVISGNRLSGPIPVGLANLATLESIVLSGNQLTGSIPAELGNLPSVEWIDFADNRLTGPIPAGLANSTTLSNIFLSGNRLTGPLPDELGLMADLMRLRIDRNRIVGEIPSMWATLTNLVDDRCDFSYNGLYTPSAGFSAWLDQKQTGAESWTETQTPPPSDFTIVGQNGVAIWGGVQHLGLIDVPGGHEVEVSEVGGGSTWIGSWGGSKISNSWEVHGLEPGIPYAFRARSWTWPHPENTNMIVGEWTEPVFATLDPDSSTLYVATDGIVTNDCLSPGAPCPTISDALTLAGGHERIVVAPGTYLETLTIPFSVDIIGAGRDEVTVDGGAAGSVATVYSGSTYVGLRGMTLTNGSNYAGAGIQVEGGAVLTVNECLVSNSVATYGGGLRLFNGASAFLARTSIRDNEAYEHGGGIDSLGLLWVEDSDITGNTAAHFGGINASTPTHRGGLYLDRSTVSGNSCPTDSGGGIRADADYLGIFNSSIIQNTALAGGGVAAAVDTWQIRNSTVSGNITLEEHAPSGLWLAGTTGELSHVPSVKTPVRGSPPPSPPTPPPSRATTSSPATTR